MSQTILVTGASGHLGQRVVELLTQSYRGKIIAGSRSPEKLNACTTKGVEVRAVDFDKPETLEKAFKGVEKLILISTDALAVPGQRLKQHVNAVSAAKVAGVKHVIYTSLTSTEKSPIFFAPDHYGTEVALKDSGMNYTILRNNWYAENTYAGLAQAVASGQLVHSAGSGKVGYISREDCAQVAAAVASTDKYNNKILDVTGEKSFSFDDLAALASRLSGKEIKAISISEADLRKALTAHQLPGFVVDLFATFERAVNLGDQDVTNTLVFELTGKHAQTVEENLKANLGQIGIYKH